jgi:hypothetical protein
MHPHLIDWFRNIHLHPEVDVIKKRWDTASKYAKSSTSADVCSLLRLFLYSKPDEGERKKFEDALLKLDVEFPVKGNEEELRLMAGIVMITTFTARSERGVAFALGLKSATALKRQLDPAHDEIIRESDRFLSEESERQRPRNFDESVPNHEDGLVESFRAVEASRDGEEGELESSERKYQQDILAAIRSSHDLLANQVRRLAEESALLWWMTNEFSDSLDCRTADVSASKYAIVAAVEAADRTHLLPPPRSMRALFIKAVGQCKKANSPITLEQVLSGVGASWRKEFVKALDIKHCSDLVPLMTGIVKAEEFGSLKSSLEVLPNLCPGVVAGSSSPPWMFSFATYIELMFIRALKRLEEPS